MRKSGGRATADSRAVRAERAGLEQARAQERQEIARDLHDTVIQPIAALVTSFESLRYEAVTPGMLEAYLGAWQELARESLDALRATLAGIRTQPHAELGLPEALRRNLAPKIRSNGVRLTIESRNWPGFLALELTSNLYLLVREALTNVEKHARASEVTVLLTRDARNLRVIIADDGVGFREGARHTAQAQRPGSGVGVFGMRERAHKLGGRFSLSSSPGNGVRLEISIPCPREDHQTGSETLAGGLSADITGISQYLR